MGQDKRKGGKQEGGGERTLPSPKHLPSLIFRWGPEHQPSMTTLRGPCVAEVFCLRLNFPAPDVNANNVRSCCPPRSTRVFQEYFLCNMLFWVFFVSSGFKFGSSLSRTSLANLGDQSPLFFNRPVIAATKRASDPHRHSSLLRHANPATRPLRRAPRDKAWRSGCARGRGFLLPPLLPAPPGAGAALFSWAAALVPGPRFARIWVWPYLYGPWCLPPCPGPG